MAECNKEGSEALRIALQTEKDGIEMYTKASEATAHAFGKKLFLSLVEDEKSHIRMIEALAEGAGLASALEDARAGTPRERMKTIFSESKDDLAEQSDASPDELAALTVAMELEQNGHEFYKRAAAEARCGHERALFEKLAEEEHEHYQILSSTHEYLSQTGKWYLWDEQGLLDG